MRSLGIQGAVRGKAAETTVSDKATPCPADHVNLEFQARRPNLPSRVLLTRAASQAARPPADGRGVSDFIYVSTWQGFVYTAFVIDAFARRPIAGQRGLAGVAHGPLRRHWAGLVLDALEQALHERRPVRRDGLIHHSDPSRASWPSMAETVIGHYKTEVIHRRGSWQTLQAVELATLALFLLLKAAASLSGLLRCCSQGVDWFNNRRLLQPIGRIPPAEAETAFH